MNKDNSALHSSDSSEKKAVFLLNFALFSIMLALSCLFLFIFFKSFVHSELKIQNSEVNIYSDGTLILCQNEQNTVSLVIDAGHGGEDGGAVSSDGVMEKDLNLTISFILNDIFRSSGVNTVMTRNEDKMLYTDNIKGKKKSQDLKNRALVAKEYPDSLFLSIHMNKFAESKYSGLQVYYSKTNSVSSRLADKIQSFTKAYLQPDNNRETKASGSGIYLLEHIQNPAVLVECGFLSNPEETAKLTDKDYQKKLAVVIYAAVMDHINSDSDTDFIESAG